MKGTTYLTGSIASTLKPEYPKVNPGFCFHYAAFTSYGHNGILLMLAVAAALAVYAIIRSMKFGQGWDKERQFRQSQSGTYGTSGLMEKDEMQEVFEIAPPSMCEGTILGELHGMAVCLPKDTPYNRHIAVYGAPGTGKSFCFSNNQILQCARRGDSMIITDSKIDGGLYSITAEYLRSLGYTVKIFNLVIPECSDSWNCLSEVHGDQIRAQMFVDIIMKNTTEGRADEFWLNLESNLLKALVLFVSLNPGYSDTQKNLGTVYDLLVQNTDDQLEAMFDSLTDDHPAKFPYLIYSKNKKNEKVNGGVAQGIGGRLQIFQARGIRNITSANEIDLELPAKEKCAYFVTLSDQDSTHEFLSSLFFLSFLSTSRGMRIHTAEGNARYSPSISSLTSFPTSVKYRISSESLRQSGQGT
jgi:Type IV secretory pathway, VirD4 components